MPIDDINHIDVGIVGTFDVENYGDLLFPLIAQAALSRRDQRIRVRAISPNSKSSASWPFQVVTTKETHNIIPALSALLIGGGQIVRFDKHYPVHVPYGVNVPIAYWLVPAVLAATIGKPVFWNAVGAWTGTPPAPWYTELIQRVFAASHFVGARDVASQVYLSKLAPKAAVHPLPDTAFSLAQLWPLNEPSDDYVRWRQALNLDGQYIVIQANSAIGEYRSTIENIMRSFANVTAIILPVCWCHGDRAEIFPHFDGAIASSPHWLHPLLIREIIGRSQLLVASSLHACITGLCYGVPVLRAPFSPVPTDRKFELLKGFDGLCTIDDDKSIERLLKRGIKTDARIAEIEERLDRYWDDVSQTAIRSSTGTYGAANSGMLEWASQICDTLDKSAAAVPDIVET